MPKNADSYVATLVESLLKMEDAYGMRKEVNGGKLLTRPVSEVIAYYNSTITSMDKTAINKANAAVGREVITLSYVSARMSFYNKKRLDYSKYPNMKVAAKILIRYTKAKTLDEKTLRSVNKLIALLIDIDKKYVNFRNGLAYRYLRIFIVAILFGNYCNASIIADFILKQFITKEDL